MKVLHTSDWHIGRKLYNRKRYEEFESFLTWLFETIQRHEIEVLLVAGDIFDTIAPSNRAQQLYYRFLHQVVASPCRHVVVIAGNHDSPSFLDAPKDLLKALHVHVVGSYRVSAEDEVLVLRDRYDAPELIVCAVPYLRDRDIRFAEPGEAIEDKGRKLLEGIRNHYADVAALAEEERKRLGSDIPIIGMGHLFTDGGRVMEGDGVRDLYVGSLAQVDAGAFPPCFDYLALGHLHVPQKVRGLETARYSGSPLPMGFGEAKQQKSVCIVEFEKRKATVDLIDVPVFQKLERIQGDWATISNRITELSSVTSPLWLEVIYDGIDILDNLTKRLEDLVSNTHVEVLCTKYNRIIAQGMPPAHDQETLDDLDENEVFQRCLDVHAIPEHQRPALFEAYREVVSSLYEDDVQAE